MWNAIVGDFIGSYYEHLEIKGKNLKLINSESTITDDSILMIATADAIINKREYSDCYREWFKKYPDSGYGNGFTGWVTGQTEGDSFGNGASVRSMLIGFSYNDEETILKEAKKSALCSHSHSEGIDGAQATALSVFYAREKKPFNEIMVNMQEKFDYLLFYDLEELHKNYSFDSSAENTVPIAIYIGFNSESLLDCIQKCLYIGGDTDTILAIALLIVQAREIEPDNEEKIIIEHCKKYVLEKFRDVHYIANVFSDKFNINN